MEQGNKLTEYCEKRNTEVNFASFGASKCLKLVNWPLRKHNQLCQSQCDCFTVTPQLELIAAETEKSAIVGAKCLCLFTVEAVNWLHSRYKCTGINRATEETQHGQS